MTSEVEPRPRMARAAAALARSKVMVAFSRAISVILPLSGIETSNGLASGCRLRYVTERLGQHVPLGDDRLHQIGVDCHPETPATAAWAPSRRSAVEMCSALQLDASQLPNLVPPCDTNMRRQPQLCPEPDELID